MTMMNPSATANYNYNLPATAGALSHQSPLLVSTYPLAGAWSNKINYLTNISMTAREPLLVRRGNALKIAIERFDTNCLSFH
jgi:hypothetical protein